MYEQKHRLPAFKIDAATIIGYPKIGLRENTGTTSEMTPNAGSTRM
jgi:hypothetical protein